MKKALLAFALSLILLGCLQQEPIEFEGVEVDEYKGEKLSSINDFRENSIRGPQYINASTYRLEVSGLVENPDNYTSDEITGSYQPYSKVVTLNCVEGWSVTILWEGVLLRDILDEAKPKPEAKTVIFHAYDGYSTSFPLEYFYENDIIMAYKMNNVTLPPERGYPFQLVAESKWGYKWIKWITEIELSDDTDYQGYWESRGYSNSADITGNQPTPTTSFPNITPVTPTPTPTPTPNPTNTPNPSPTPSPTYPNTPEPSPSDPPSNEIGLPLEYTATTIGIAAAIVIIVLLLKRK